MNSYNGPATVVGSAEQSQQQQQQQAQASQTSNNEQQRVVQHLMVVGFHHKRGCMVEFCYPPIELEESSEHEESNLSTEDPVRLPASWNILASLAIPDGAHNFENDTVFFHLPDHISPNRTLFGVSCYRQIATKDLLVRSADYTRSSVQKAVIVLMNYPVYGLIEYKLDIVTRVYFGERDFTKTEILVDAYNDLNRHISPAIVNSPDILSGLSVRSLFVRFGTQVVTLFKLLLLEKKTIFLHSPIRELTSSILTLCSLIPGLVQGGLNDCAIEYNKKQMPGNAEEKLEDLLMLKFGSTNCPNAPIIARDQSCDTLSFNEDTKSQPRTAEDAASLNSKDTDEEDEEETEAEIQARLLDLWNKPPSIHGLPLEIFGPESYLMPYFSISYFDILINDRVRSCIGGSSNQIFRRWQNDIDVFVVANQIEIDDLNLRRALRPSTEDMHFISYLVRAILTDSESGLTTDIFDDSQHEFYEGSDEWIRMHFKSYLLHLMRCSLLDDDSREFRSFNPFFMELWKQTYNYKVWHSSPLNQANIIRDIEPVHPFFSNRLNYLKLRLTNLLLHRQEFLNQSFNRVANVGGQALNQARSTVNSWLSNIGTSLQEKAREATVAASTSTWKSYLPASIATRATQILSPTDSPAEPNIPQPNVNQSPARSQGTPREDQNNIMDQTPAVYEPEENETSV